MSLLDEGRKNPVVETLYQEINAQTPIVYTESATEDSWSSETKNGRTEITGARTRHPDAALAHELLHAKLKIRGYKQYTVIASMDEKQHAASVISGILDNEIQHHRFFQEFIQMGFSPVSLSS